MANLLDNNGSSDDDFSDNLRLAERLRINRDGKNLGYRKKNILDDQSSSSSLEMQFEPFKNGPSRYNGAHNKKRQNGDKSLEMFANPKRTCLSNRYPRSPDYQNKKKSGTEEMQVAETSSNILDSNEFLFADKTYEDHLHNLADQDNPVFNNSKQYSKKKILSNMSDHVMEDVTCLSPLVSEKQKQPKEFKLVRCKNHPSTSSKQLNWRDPQTDQGEHSKTLKSVIKKPVSFISQQTDQGEHSKTLKSVIKKPVPFISQQTDQGEHSKTLKSVIKKPVPFISQQKLNYHTDSQPSTSEINVVHYVDSASDEDSRSMLKSGSLKGGKQSPDVSLSHKRVLGRKPKKKVLDSDEDSNEEWAHSNQSTRCLIFSSSDSEVESSCKGAQKLVGSTKIGGFTYPLSNSSKNTDFQNPLLDDYQSTSFSIDNNLASGSSSLPYQYKSPRSCRNRKTFRSKPSDLSPNSFQPNRSNGGSGRGRSRVNIGERYTRRSGSPHPRNLLSAHSRMARSEASNSANGRSLTGSRTRRANGNLATTYPDLFDAEDESSEVEFFTANSYSDTETSAESFGGLRISSTVQNSGNDDVVCEHSINIGSSEDEISVVFSTGPSNSECRIEGQVTRNRLPRRALGRRRQRGSWRHLHDAPNDVVSLSPDPVEQVRQVEDDEQFARILQAQFDAELDHNYTPPRNVPAVPRHRSYRSSPVNMLTRDSDSDIEYNWGNNPVNLPMPSSMLSSMQIQHSPTDYNRGSRMNRFPVRPTTPNFFGSIFYNNRRVDRNRRRPTSSDQRNNVARLFEATLFGLPFEELLHSDDSFETFLGIAELNGDVSRGLQKSEINRLPTRQYLASNSAGSSNELPHKRAGLNKECQVCLSDYENGDTLRILPCFHEFHTPCIDPWLKINHTCPVCRVVVDLEG